MKENDGAFDVVIVGAGAVGALFAARLASAGKHVLILEAGPAWKLTDLVSSQIWARRLKWGGPEVGRAGDAAFGHNMGTGRGFGGSALHHYAGWPRLHPEDFRTHTLYGRARDWPFEYDTLRPFYDRVQTQCGLSGDAKREVWRPPGVAYPMPALKAFRQAEILARGFERLGLRVAPAPLAINSIAYRGRPACINDGWCDAGCPTGALANPLVTYLPVALKSGAQIMSRATVTRIRLDPRGRTEGVEYVDSSHTLRFASADLVILAAASVQNARLLLSSAQTGAPTGIGNAHDLVGRYFVCHNVVNVYGLFKEETENHLGVSAGPLISQDGYRKDSRPGAFGSYQWGIAPALKPNDLLGIANSRAELFGNRLHGFMQEAARHLAAMSAVCETLPQPNNRIELTSQLDAHGVPLPRIVRNADPDGRALTEYVVSEGLKISAAAGAKESWRGVTATAHPLGGTVMGVNPADSVTDSYGRVHGVPGLMIGGGSLFPTAGGGSPTFTMLAMAERAADCVLGTV